MALTDLMTKNLITVEPEDSIEQLYNIFNSTPIHHILVVEGSKLLGIVSDRDVLKSVSPFVNTKAEEPKDRFTLNRKARQIMNASPITINETDSIILAAKTLLDNKVSLLPVVDENQIIKGVLSWKGVMKHIVS